MATSMEWISNCSLRYCQTLYVSCTMRALCFDAVQDHAHTSLTVEVHELHRPGTVLSYGQAFSSEHTTKIKCTDQQLDVSMSVLVEQICPSM